MGFMIVRCSCFWFRMYTALFFVTLWPLFNTCARRYGCCSSPCCSNRGRLHLRAPRLKLFLSTAAAPTLRNAHWAVPWACWHSSFNNTPIV